MKNNLKGVPTTAQPWARTVEERLGKSERLLTNLGYDVGQIPELDKTVYFETEFGQNIANPTEGKLDPTYPVKVRFVSSTGLFEVTVSLAGIVRAGAVFGAGFESVETPYSIANGIPKHAVLFSAPEAQTSWSPFAGSYSTVIAARPGVQDLSLYLYAKCAFSVNSAAYLERARLSVKAV